MEKPSIDRIDNDGHYEFNNCQFIEMQEHNKKDKGKSIIQCNLKGKYIKEWDSILKAGRDLGIDASHIVKCCKGKNKTIGGFKWKYKENEYAF